MTGPKDQPVEVHRVAGLQRIFVDLIDFRRLDPGSFIGKSGGRLLGHDQLGFQLINGFQPTYVVGRHWFTSGRRLVQRVHKNGFPVRILVENRKIGRYAKMRSVLAKELGAEGVEGSDEGALHQPRYQLIHALAHLRRCLGGEGQRKDTEIAAPTFIQDSGDACRHHAGLAGTWSRQDQGGALRPRSSLSLVAAQALQDRVKLGCHSLPAFKAWTSSTNGAGINNAKAGSVSTRRARRLMQGILFFFKATRKSSADN